jgi:hypothetical protein
MLNRDIAVKQVKLCQCPNCKRLYYIDYRDDGEPIDLPVTEGEAVAQVLKYGRILDVVCLCCTKGGCHMVSPSGEYF